jgi:beta-aspartyl-peptidase (threonine type)
VAWSIKGAEETMPESPDVQYAIAIHGGAGSSLDDRPADERQAVRGSLERALNLGRQMLDRGQSSLDTVEQVIRLLEDDPLFNAGRGAVLNSCERHELDASIMDGQQRQCGAVAAVTTVKNPISLARLVMTRTPHVLLIGEGADAFAQEMQVQLVQQDYFATERAWQRLRKAREASAAAAPPVERETVGCVALDRAGNLAAGTSTGGLTNKRPGRVGDSPLVAAGTYADNRTCAVSCSGIGEQFIRHAVAYDVAARMAYQSSSLQDAVHHVIHQTLKPDDGGLIAVDRHGTIVIDFNTPGMSRGAADSTGRFTIQLGRD